MVHPYNAQDNTQPLAILRDDFLENKGHTQRKRRLSKDDKRLFSRDFQAFALSPLLKESASIIVGGGVLSCVLYNTRNADRSPWMVVVAAFSQKLRCCIIRRGEHPVRDMFTARI